VAHARVQQPHVIVDFGCGRNRGARVARGIFLADGNRRSDAGDFVDIRLFDAFEELPRVGGQGLNVAALPFSIERVEREARFPGT